ncbi:DUF3472 domain-containing protein [Chryseobacterium cucumeris]|uniref:DUF3472 domain-containing protein n=1 Tax=Chryseobacterium cucumeris TaxID=1813611 RepID=UPI0023F2B38E|nr:DUF3472 domain-containing protein [Chryseobacterium cucumeris]
MKIKKIIYTVFLFFISCNFFIAASPPRIIPYILASEVPLAGNAFITESATGSTETITNSGLENWTSENTVVSTYFKVSNAGILSISLKANIPLGNSNVKVTINGVSQNVSINSSSYQIYSVGDFNVSPGYVKVDLQGLTKTGNYFGNVSHIIFDGPAALGNNVFCNDPNYYYWARRGPSCHLAYTVPTSNDVLYYYNEVKIPAGEDKIGSFFMVNGFQEGYFGIQVNSETERRVLFSVWSPFPTDDPNNIPEDHKIKLNCKGTDVVTGEFGNEGAGGKSYLQFNWQPDVTYKFLLKGQPDGTGKTDYSAWFFAPELGIWKLIASWKRPFTNTYLKSFYSFTENFYPDYGYLGRKAEYGNQWVQTLQGEWLPISQAKFTVDATYTANQRVDASGGTVNNTFFLRNGGFTNEVTPLNFYFNVATPTQAPDINVNDLPICGTLSVKNSNIRNDIKLYPNPAHSFIKIKGLNANFWYKIFSSDGKIVKQGLNTGNEININDLLKGSYVIYLYTDKQQGSFKFIKN